MKSGLSKKAHISKPGVHINRSQAAFIFEMSKLKINFYGNKIAGRQPSLSTELLIPVGAP